ncbi:MAG: ATP-binding protein, partial [Burkholderiales bacterium]|nr:ATP-binding protein [Burkholderiales bacterium]
RLSLIDQDGRILIGPRDTPPGRVQAIVVDGRNVASLSLAPLRQLAHTSASGFLLSQMRQILWLAGALILLSVLLSVWLARHLLKPVASLRSVTRRISQGQLEARAEIVNQDELGELASHVNAMAQTLQQNEAQRSKMLANVSHELRTPLTVIRGEIEALIDGIRPTSPDALKSLHEEVLHLSKLVDDIHQVNLAHAGELAFQLQRIDLCALLSEVLQRYRPRIQAASLTLSSQIPSEPLYVKADAGRLTQVLSNLLENSLRYTDAGGQLQCSLSRNGPLIELTLEDSAPGVPDGSHTRLFERLYRADQDRSRQRGGSGLGLSICKALVESNHGKIAALPSSLGGIKIVIRLPAVP